MCFMVGEPPIQLRPLRLGQWGCLAALGDVVPQRLYQLELFFQTEFAGLVKKGWAHWMSIAALRVGPNLESPSLPPPFSKRPARAPRNRWGRSGRGGRRGKA